MSELQSWLAAEPTALAIRIVGNGTACLLSRLFLTHARWRRAFQDRPKHCDLDREQMENSKGFDGRLAALRDILLHSVSKNDI